MKALIIALALLGSSAFASTPAERLSLATVIKKDVMIHAVLANAKKIGESCSVEITDYKDNSAQGIEFAADINCSTPANEFTGGGVVLMIRMTGRAFGDLLDNLVLRVDKAG